MKMKKAGEKFCIRCHKKISIDAQVCDYCGHPQKVIKKKSTVLPQTGIPLDARKQKSNSGSKPLSVSSSISSTKPKTFQKKWTGTSKGFTPFDTELFIVSSKVLKITYNLTNTIDGELEIYLYQKGVDHYIEKISTQGNNGVTYFYPKSKGEYFLRIMPLRCSYEVVLSS
jgi:hypothetical protein